jgi:Putative Actinobacterial Holin-X, holin superfamily III
LAGAVPTWAALLIVAGVLLLIAVALALVAMSLFKRGAPPVPEQAIEEARITTEALKSDVATP